MTYNPEEMKQKVIKKFIFLSDKYHKLSLLFYELSNSLRLESKNKSWKEFKEYLKELNLDLNKIEKLSKSISELSLGDLKND